MTYQVEVTAPAARQIRRLPEPDKLKIFNKIDR